jgi:hypothetical protein
LIRVDPTWLELDVAGKKRRRSGRYDRSRDNARGVEVPASLVEKIKALMPEWTEAQVSLMAGISRNTLSRVLAGLTVRKKTLALLRERLSEQS